jgi:hypothetical protein
MILHKLYRLYFRDGLLFIFFLCGIPLISITIRFWVDSTKLFLNLQCLNI